MIDQYSFSSATFKDLTGLKLWEARHSMVLNFIDQKGIQTMIDFGTNEATLLQKVQRGIQIKRLIGVDVDMQVMQKAIQNLQPQARQSDLEFIRPYDQLVQLYHGSALQKYIELKNLKADFITLVQVIEHIQQKHLSELNQNIFGYLKPTYVFISTPNSDFNPVFKWENGKRFRHDDHKFQWTRKEFAEYVQGVCQKYNYRATITGVGLALAEEHMNKGYCSQIAIFENLENSLDQESTKDLGFHSFLKTFNEKTLQQPTTPLKLIYTHTNYHWQSRQQQLISIVLKQIKHLCVSNGGFFPWNLVVQELLKKRVIKMLSGYNLQWNDESFLRKFVCDMFVGSEVVCGNDGIVMMVREEKTMMSEESQMEMEQRRANEGYLDGNSPYTDSQIIRNQTGLIIYKYDDSQLLSRQRRNTKSHKSNASIKSRKSKKSQKISSSQQSLSSQQSSSSNQSYNSWQSIEVPQNEVSKRVTKRKRMPFKSQKPTLVKEQMNDNNDIGNDDGGK